MSCKLSRYLCSISESFDLLHFKLIRFENLLLLSWKLVHIYHGSVFTSWICIFFSNCAHQLQCIRTERHSLSTNFSAASLKAIFFPTCLAHLLQNCLHQKLQSVTPLNWTCIATLLVQNVKLWSNFGNVYPDEATINSTEFYPGRLHREVQPLTLIFIIHTIFDRKGNPSVYLLLTNRIPFPSLDIPETWRSLPA